MVERYGCDQLEGSSFDELFTANVLSVACLGYSRQWVVTPRKSASGAAAKVRYWRVSASSRLACSHVRQLVWVADDVDRADPSILEIQRGRLETAVRVVADVAGQAVDDGRADQGRPLSRIA